jgi:biopolymer transport protein ExbB/TolQ
MSKYWLLVGAGAILAAFYFESRRYGAERFYALKIRREVREKSAADRVSRGHLHDTESVGTSGQTTNEMQRATERMLSDMEEARSIVVWGIGALPALGFIGTVRGIMQALGSADKLTQPGATQIELAAGMSDVTARLSLAFSTTLFALLAGLLIGFLLYLQAKQEKRLLNNIGRTLPRMRDEHAE